MVVAEYMHDTSMLGSETRDLHVQSVHLRLNSLSQLFFTLLFEGCCGLYVLISKSVYHVLHLVSICWCLMLADNFFMRSALQLMPVWLMVQPNNHSGMCT